MDGFPDAVMPPAEDIASMEVLKDASSTAIYGSRGANGVVLVTTKSGKSGTFQIDFNASGSFQHEINRLEVLNATDYATYINEIDPDLVTYCDCLPEWGNLYISIGAGFTIINKA